VRRDRLFPDLFPPFPERGEEAAEAEPPRVPPGEAERGPGGKGRRDWLGWLLEVLVVVLIILLVAAAIPLFGWYGWEGVAEARRAALKTGVISARVVFVGLMNGTAAAITLFLYALILADFVRRARERDDAAGREWLDLVLRAFVLAFVGLLPQIEGHCGTGGWKWSVGGIGGVVLLVAVVRYVVVPLGLGGKPKGKD